VIQEGGPGRRLTVLSRFEGSETIANAAFQALVDRYRGRPLAEYALAPPEVELS